MVSISLSLLLHDAHWHRGGGALATNVTIFMEHDTQVEGMLVKYRLWQLYLGATLLTK